MPEETRHTFLPATSFLSNIYHNQRQILAQNWINSRLQNEGFMEQIIKLVGFIEFLLRKHLFCPNHSCLSQSAFIIVTDLMLTINCVQTVG